MKEENVAGRWRRGERGKTCSMSEIEGGSLFLEFGGILYVFGVTWVVAACYY